MKGVAHREPNYQSIAKVYEKVISVSGPDFGVSIVFEYFPLTKISSIPNDATAFRRDPTPTVLFLAKWEGDSENNTERGRNLARELAPIITGGQGPKITKEQSFGYSNYGAASSLQRFC